MNHYFNRFVAFRDRSLFFQLSLFVWLLVVFAFTIGRFWQMAQQNKSYNKDAVIAISAGFHSTTN